MLRPSMAVVLLRSLLGSAPPVAMLAGVPLWMRLAGFRTTDPPIWILAAVVVTAGLDRRDRALLRDHVRAHLGARVTVA